MQCKHCGEPIQDGYSFCMNCGTTCEKEKLPVSTEMNNQIIPKQSNKIGRAHV